MKVLIFKDAGTTGPNIRMSELEDAIHGRISILEEPLRLKGRYRLTRKEQDELHTAQQAGYLRYSRRRTPNLKNVYFAWCELVNRPCLTLEETKTKVTIHLDYISTLSRLSHIARNGLAQWTEDQHTRCLTYIKPDEANWFRLPRTAADSFLKNIYPKLKKQTWTIAAHDQFAKNLQASRARSTQTPHPNDPQVEILRLKPPPRPKQLLIKQPLTPTPLGHFGCYICGASHELRDKESWAHCGQLLYEHVAGSPDEFDFISERYNLDPEPYAYRLLWHNYRGTLSPKEAFNKIHQLTRLTSQYLIIPPLSVMNEELSVSNGILSFRKRYRDWKKQMAKLPMVLCEQKLKLAREQEQLYPPTHPAWQVVGRFQRGNKPPTLQSDTARELHRVTQWIGEPNSQSRGYEHTRTGYKSVLTLTFPLSSSSTGTTRLEDIEQEIEERLHCPPLHLGRCGRGHHGMQYLPEAFDLDRRFWLSVSIHERGQIVFQTQALKPTRDTQEWYPLMGHPRDKDFSKICHRISGYLLSKIDPESSKHLSNWDESNEIDTW